MPKRSIFLLVFIASLTAGLLRLYAYDYSEFPQIDFVSPPNFSIGYGDCVDIFGSASSRFEIASVEIDKQKALLKSGVFELPSLPLVLGKNIFLIKATDIFGNRKNFLYTIYRENPPIEPVLRLETKSEIPDEEVPADTPVDTPKAEGFTAPEQSAKTANPSANKRLLSGTRPVTVYTNTAYTADTASNSAQTYQAAASPVAANSVAAPAEQSSGKHIVTFSSPYDKQVITENSLKIGGRFAGDAHVTAITVNGQACTLDASTGTFTGPLLISPGEARRRNVTSDNSEYIIMKVDPNTHSGKNILKVMVTDSFGRTDKQEIAFYYYQLFVKSNTWGETIYNTDNGGTISLPIQNRQSYNKNLFYIPPYANWLYPEKAYREDYPRSAPFVFSYFEDMKAFYFAENYPIIWTQFAGYDHFLTGHRFVNTRLMLHTPPLKELPFILILKHFQLFEDIRPLFTWSPPDAIAGYSLNSRPITPMETPLNSYDRFGYVLIDKFTPDTDYSVEIQTPDYGDGFLIYGAYWNQHFIMEDVDTLTGDILVDSNNDGFLSGNDNAVEQVAPGCVFWINNDDDYDEFNYPERRLSTYSNHTLDFNDQLSSRNNDGADVIINGIRDLEDFFPINITIPQIKQWQDKENVKFYLKSEGKGALRIYKRISADNPDNNKEYLTDMEAVVQQYKQTTSFKIQDKSEVLLSPIWFDENGEFKGIFEGTQEGDIKIGLYVELINTKKKEKILLDEAILTFKNLSVNGRPNLTNEFYQTFDIRGGNPFGFAPFEIVHADGTTFSTDPTKVFIWTHGYNCDEPTARLVADTVYKRLYQTGFRGAFYAISWRAGVGGVTDFNADWINSYRSGNVAANIIENIRKNHPNAQINVAVHSLGSNLMSYALRILAERNTVKINNLILCEAALPGEVYSGIPQTIEYTRDPPLFLTLTRHGFFDDIYGISLEAINGKVYNTFCVEDRILNRWFELNARALKLPVSLDDNYIYVRRGIDTGINGDYFALGHAPVDSTYINDGKFINATLFHSRNLHPYGIRHHGSMMDDYYFDVVDFHRGLVDPGNPVDGFTNIRR